jgi:hypothetical protein
LIDAEKRVGSDHPFPARRPDDHERHRHADEPAENENALTPPGIGELARDEIGECLDYAEADDEGDDEGRRRDAELLRPDEWDDRSFDPDHAADEGIDHDKQRKLLPILFQAEPDR